MLSFTISLESYPLWRIEKELIIRLKQEKNAPPIYKWVKVSMVPLT